MVHQPHVEGLRRRQHRTKRRQRADLERREVGLHLRARSPASDARWRPAPGAPFAGRAGETPGSRPAGTARRHAAPSSSRRDRAARRRPSPPAPRSWSARDRPPRAPRRARPGTGARDRFRALRPRWCSPSSISFPCDRTILWRIVAGTERAPALAAALAFALAGAGLAARRGLAGGRDLGRLALDRLTARPRRGARLLPGLQPGDRLAGLPGGRAPARGPCRRRAGPASRTTGPAAASPGGRRMIETPNAIPRVPKNRVSRPARTACSGV